MMWGFLAEIFKKLFARQDPATGRRADFNMVMEQWRKLAHGLSNRLDKALERLDAVELDLEGANRRCRECEANRAADLIRLKKLEDSLARLEAAAGAKPRRRGRSGS